MSFELPLTVSEVLHVEIQSGKKHGQKPPGIHCTETGTHEAIGNPRGNLKSYLELLGSNLRETNMLTIHPSHVSANTGEKQL